MVNRCTKGNGPFARIRTPLGAVRQRYLINPSELRLRGNELHLPAPRAQHPGNPCEQDQTP